MYESFSGAFWVGTDGGGLNSLDRSTGIFYHFTEHNGLPSNVVYGIEEDKEQKVVAQFSPLFDFVAASPLRYTLEFGRKEIMQALMMTPNYWHLSQEVREMAEKMDEMETTVSFCCLTFIRR